VVRAFKQGADRVVFPGGEVRVPTPARWQPVTLQLRPLPTTGELEAEVAGPPPPAAVNLLKLEVRFVAPGGGAGGERETVPPSSDDETAGLATTSRTKPRDCRFVVRGLRPEGAAAADGGAELKVKFAGKTQTLGQL
jgi:hypothetical protein